MGFVTQLDDVRMSRLRKDIIDNDLLDDVLKELATQAITFQRYADRFLELGVLGMLDTTDVGAEEIRRYQEFRRTVSWADLTTSTRT